MQEGEEIEGVVSLSVGTSPTQDALEDYVEFDYSTGESRSQLADDFGTGWYDHDFMDTSFHERPTRSLPELLRRCSYDFLIIPKFVELCGEFLPTELNSVVLLYDFQHNGESGPGAGAIGPVKLRYMGSIAVEMPWPD